MKQWKSWRMSLCVYSPTLTLPGRVEEWAVTLEKWWKGWRMRHNLILQPLYCSTYVTAHSPTLRCFTYVAAHSTTPLLLHLLQDLHLRHLASCPWFSSSSLTSPVLENSILYFIYAFCFKLVTRWNCHWPLLFCKVQSHPNITRGLRRLPLAALSCLLAG